jgi:uncharacterized protein (TIGR02147 family)
MRLNVFQFHSYSEFVHHLMANYPGKKKSLNLKQFSDLIGYKSPRSIAMVLKGQRAPSQEMLTKISDKVKLGPKEVLYLQLLMQKQKNKDQQKLKIIEEKISQLKPQSKSTRKLVIEDFKFISEWYFAPLLMKLLNNHQSDIDFEKISLDFKSKVSSARLKEAYQILKNINILNELHQIQETLFDIPSQAIQEHHKQMMQKAIESLSEELVINREVSSNTFKMQKNKMEAAKHKIREFTDEFIKEFHDDQAESIFQLNTQLFKHTRN